MSVLYFFFLNDPAPTEIYTLSLHDALPIYLAFAKVLLEAARRRGFKGLVSGSAARSEEHTSELQSHSDLVCRLLLEKKKTLPTTPAVPPKRRRLTRARPTPPASLTPGTSSR